MVIGELLYLIKDLNNDASVYLDVGEYGENIVPSQQAYIDSDGDLVIERK